MARVIAQMVARNEEGRFLDMVLSNLKDQVDEIVFTDDASDDNTPQIAENHGCHVMVMDKPTFTLNEGVLRQKAWNHLRNYAEQGDWILAIDADEIFFPGESYNTLLEQNRYDVLGIQFYHMWDETSYRVDKAWKPNISTRFFRYREEGQFRQRRLASGSEPTYVLHMVRAGRFLRNTGMKMQHLGYMRDEDKQAKYQRYIELDKGDFHSLKHIESIMDERITTQKWKD